MADGDLRAIFRRKLPHIHWVSIETGSTGRGIPDSNYCYTGAEGWLEYKLATGWAVGLRPEQCAWLTRRARAGGRVWVAVRRQTLMGPRKGAAVDELWLIRGEAAAELKGAGLQKVSPAALAGVWIGGPAKWCWPEVEAALLGDHSP